MSYGTHMNEQCPRRVEQRIAVRNLEDALMKREVGVGIFVDVRCDFSALECAEEIAQRFDFFV